MPKIRVTEVIKLPTGTPRFQDTVPAIAVAYQAKVTEGKVTRVPSTWVNHPDGCTTTTTTSIWNSMSDYEVFRDDFQNNYTCLQAEYYYSITSHPDNRGKNLTKTITITDEN